MGNWHELVSQCPIYASALHVMKHGKHTLQLASKQTAEANKAGTYGTAMSHYDASKGTFKHTCCRLPSANAVGDAEPEQARTGCR